MYAAVKSERLNHSYMKTLCQSLLRAARCHRLTGLSFGMLAWLAPFIGVDRSLAQDSETQVVNGHVPAVVKKLHLTPVDRLPATQHLDLVISLPHRNEPMLKTLLQQLYDSLNPKFHHFLTPAQFTEQFGPTEPDYADVLAFARSHGLTVKRTVPNRNLVDVNGTVADIEKALQLSLRVYQHPNDTRRFYAPDSEPTLDRRLAVRHISGLDNYYLPHPSSLHVKSIDPTAPKPQGSSGAFGYLGDDFRNAYVKGTSLNGSGQVVGLVEMAGYISSVITTYENKLPSHPNVPVINVLLDGLTQPLPYDGDPEAPLDIEMVIAMAPGVSQVTVRVVVRLPVSYRTIF